MANPPNPNPIHRLSHHLNAQPQYFVCRRCRTPVLHHSDCLGLLQEEDVYGLLCDCDYPFNVRTHDAIHRFFYDLPINNVRCNHCSRLIGVKFIVAGDSDTDRDPPNPCVLEGTVLFYSERMLYWDGSRHSLINADLGEQITSLINFDGSRLTFYSEPFEETDEEDSE